MFKHVGPPLYAICTIKFNLATCRKCTTCHCYIKYISIITIIPNIVIKAKLPTLSRSRSKNRSTIVCISCTTINFDSINWSNIKYSYVTEIRYICCCCIIIMIIPKTNGIINWSSSCFIYFNFKFNIASCICWYWAITFS